MFALMSGKAKKDYKLVLKKLREILGEDELSSVTLDYEEAAWRAFQ